MSEIDPAEFASDEYPSSFDEYLKKCPSGDLVMKLDENTMEALQFFNLIDPELLSHRYESKKWNIKEVFNHIVDAERLFTFRSLVCIRGDQVPHNSINKGLWVDRTDVSARSMDSLLEEFETVRKTSRLLYQFATDQQLMNKCKLVDDKREITVSARAFAAVTIGHVNHHMGVVKNCYLRSY